MVGKLRALNVKVVGEGKKTVVLAHGFGTDQSAWRRILPYLQQSYTVVLFDLACAGSVHPDFFDFHRYSSLDGYVDDLIDILDALSVRRCTLVGHSVSALTAILASLRRPDLFSKLVLLCASPRYVNDEELEWGFEEKELTKVWELMEKNYVAWVNGMAPLAVGGDVPEAIQEFSRTLFSMRPDITLFIYRSIFHVDIRGILGFVRVPCCLIQTARDPSVPASVSAYLAKNLGGDTTLELLDIDGHLPHLSAPALLIPALLRALSRRVED